jgi:ankyrin repeat protein
LAHSKKDWGKYLPHLLRNPTVKLNHANNLALVYAAQNGYAQTVERLLKLPQKFGINHSDRGNSALIFAIENHHLDVVNILLKYGADPSIYNNIPLRVACNSKDPAIVGRLLEDPRVNPSAHQNCAFMKSCENGWFELLQMLLRRIELNRLDMNIKKHAFQAAAANGHFQIVEFLLSQSDSTGIGFGDNTAFLKAAENGHFEIVNLLLKLRKDLMIDPSSMNNAAFLKAAENGHTRVISLLLSLPKEAGIKPDVNDNFSFKKAAENGHSDVVDLLLSLPKESGIDPSVGVNYALRNSIYNGHYKVAKKLLSLPSTFGIDPSVDDYFPARTLCWNKPLKAELEKNSSFVQDQETEDERSELAHILLSRVSYKNVDQKRFLDCLRSNQKISPQEITDIFNTMVI